ncbi:T9SS type A sorting domain-containing protein [Flavobacterium sp. U410]|jgi:hypothetical protein
MEFKNVKLGVLLLGFGLTAHAQQTTLSSGGDASGSGGTVAYSIGQIVYTSNIGSIGSVNQGVQHPYEFITLGIENPELAISLAVFPNPTSENITLNIKDYDNEKLVYQLFDMQGKLLRSEPIANQQTQINMSSLPVATYIINVVSQENRKIQSFKIIKN